MEEEKRENVVVKRQEGEIGAAGDGVYIVAYQSLLYSVKVRLLGGPMHSGKTICSSLKSGN